MSTPEDLPGTPHPCCGDACETAGRGVPAGEVEALEQAGTRLAETLSARPGAWERFLGEMTGLAHHDLESYAHSLRVGYYASRLARGEQTPGAGAGCAGGGASGSAETRTTRQGDARLALFGGTAHDIGKCDVPVSALRARPFGEEARAQVRVHPQRGYERLRERHLFSAIIAGIHHQFQPEAYGLELAHLRAHHHLSAATCTQIHAVGGLVSLCDFYDALTTRDNDRGLVSDPRDAVAVGEVMRTQFPDQVGRIQWLQDHDVREYGVDVSEPSNAS